MELSSCGTNTLIALCLGVLGNVIALAIVCATCRSLRKRKNVADSIGNSMGWMRRCGEAAALPAGDEHVRQLADMAARTAVLRDFARATDDAEHVWRTVVKHPALAEGERADDKLQHDPARFTLETLGGGPQLPQPHPADVVPMPGAGDPEQKTQRSQQAQGAKTPAAAAGGGAGGTKAPIVRTARRKSDPQAAADMERTQRSHNSLVVSE